MNEPTAINYRFKVGSDRAQEGDIIRHSTGDTWMVISEPVAVHDNTLIVKPENLNRIDSPEAHDQLPQIKERIWRLRNSGILDRGAYTVLESLGRQTYLTPVEDGLLRRLEEYYEVDKKS